MPHGFHDDGSQPSGVLRDNFFQFGNLVVAERQRGGLERAGDARRIEARQQVSGERVRFS